MATQQIETGKVTNFDTATGVASLELPSGPASVSAGAFHSGRPARLPRPGDQVKATVRQDAAGLVVLVARLVSAP